MSRAPDSPESVSLFNIIILYYKNNNNNNSVSRWIQRTLSNPEGEKVLLYIHEKKIYTVPVLRRLQGVRVSTAYRIHKELEERLIIKKTGFYASNPNPNKAGRHPQFFALADIEVKDASHELVREAQARYEESELSYDKGLQDDYSNKIRINEIITETLEYYQNRGQISTNRPSIKEVQQYIRLTYSSLEGSKIAEIAPKISQVLYKEDSQL